MGKDIAVGVISGLVVLILGGAWKQRAWLRTWWARQMDAVDDIDEETAAEHLETLREQVIDRARLLGIHLPVSSSGNKVAYSNGETFTFIPSRQAYVAAMNSRRVDILRTYNKSAPTPLSHRDRAWLLQWLDDHPVDDVG